MATPEAAHAVETFGFDAAFQATKLETLPEGRATPQSALRKRSMSPSTSMQSINNYEIIKTIGKGNFAKVKLAKHKLTGVEVAIKIIDKTHLKESGLKKVKREVKIMKRLRHPNIVELYEVIETSTHLYLVMEYASRGEVFDYLVAHGRMKEKDARKRFREIVSALQYCHANGIVHRDLKAENLLFDENMHIKIADFGFSNTYRPSSQLDTFCGSPPYAAPELFLGKKYIGPEVDVWSLGVILYTLVSGCLPFDGNNVKELRERVLRGKYRIPFYLTQECEQLLRRFLHVAPTKRSDLTAIMSDPWMNKDFESSPLTPHEPEPYNCRDEKRFAIMESLGFNRADVINSLDESLFDQNTATYMLLEHSRLMLSPPPPRIGGQRPSSSVIGASPARASVSTADASIAEKRSRFQRRHSTAMSHVPATRSASTSGPASSAAEYRASTATGSRQRSVTEGGLSVSTAGERPDQKSAFLQRMRRGIRQSFRRSSFSGSPGPAERVSAVNREDDKPRSLRFTFSMMNTSSKDSEHLVKELTRILKLNQIEFEQTGKFLFTCMHAAIQFEMEICKLPRLSLNGIRHKRISGPSVGYKNICTKILNELEL